MALVPKDWNVVVLGRWNRAILTPAGIAKRLFGLDEGTPVEVLVPLDAIAPYQVKHDRISVVAGSDRLIIQPTEPQFGLLDRAKSLAERAVCDLPETPLTAVGINIVVAAEDSPQPLLAITTHESDSRLSDAKLKIISRSQRRTVGWHDGQINISIDSEPDGSYRIGMNFDMQSPDAEMLKSWLRIPIDEFEKASDLILREYIGLDTDEDSDDE
jgi:hypothetical protein